MSPARKTINPLHQWVARLPCLSACLSVKSHLTSGASVRRENVATYSETAPLRQVNENSCRLRMATYRDGVNRKGDKIWMEV